MTSKKAVALRICNLCHEQDISINDLANNSGMPPTTVYSMLDGKSKNPGIVSINKICNGLGISLREFFQSPLFEGLEQEIY